MPAQFIACLQNEFEYAEKNATTSFNDHKEIIDFRMQLVNESECIEQEKARVEIQLENNGNTPYYKFEFCPDGGV